MSTKEYKITVQCVDKKTYWHKRAFSHNDVFYSEQDAIGASKRFARKLILEGEELDTIQVEVYMELTKTWGTALYILRHYIDDFLSTNENSYPCRLYGADETLDFDIYGIYEEDFEYLVKENAHLAISVKDRIEVCVAIKNPKVPDDYIRKTSKVGKKEDMHYAEILSSLVKDLKKEVDHG